MRKLRKCTGSSLNTGVSKCPPDFGKMKGAILVEPGMKLPVDLTADKLEELAHADRPDRIYGIKTFVEFAPNGGEVQTAANGYGPEEVTGLSARKDTFTLDKFYPELHSALTKCHNKPWDVYFFDEDNILYGINDGSDQLAGFPISTVYSDATPFGTSSAKPTMNVTFSYTDPKEAVIDFDYVQLDFRPARLVLGLTAVKLAKTGTNSNEYKLYEVVGGNDITADFGKLLASAEDVFEGTTSAVSYNEASDTLTIASAGEVSLKSPSILFSKEIKGIEAV